MAFAKHCGAHATSAPIAPTPLQRVRGIWRTDPPVIPPKAATAPLDRRAIAAQRIGPSPIAPGWLCVANTGERNDSITPARRARTNSAMPCAELVSAMRRLMPGTARPPRRCILAPKSAANRQLPATTSTRRRARHRRATARPIRRGSATPSGRNTTPASPRGRRAMVGSGSGRR